MSLIEFITPFFKCLASRPPRWGAVQLQDVPHPSGERRTQCRVPGALLSGLRSSSLLEEGAIVLEEGRVLLCVGPRVDAPVPAQVRILIAFLVQQGCVGRLGLFSPVKTKLQVSQSCDSAESGKEGRLEL